MVEIHGKILLIHTDADKFVFVGDYLDSFNITGIEQLHNFKEIVAFKMEFPDKVILLTGNHEYHYLSGSNAQYAGHQMGMNWDFCHILDPLVRDGILQIVFEYNDFLISHAGLTKIWCNNHDVDVNNVVDDVNMLFMRTIKPFGFVGNDFYGDDIEQGPMWIRPNSLRKDKLDNFHHIVGHTTSDNKGAFENVTVIDFLSDKKYAMIENNELKIMQI